MAIFSAACCVILLFGRTASIHQKGLSFPTDSLFHMCNVMTGPEVAALSPFGRPFKKATEEEQVDRYTGCYYEFDSNDDHPQIMITVTDLGAPSEVGVAYKVYVESFRDMWQREPERISNLGDSACFGGNADPSFCDIYGLQVASGKYYIVVSFKGYYDKIAAREKQESGVMLVKLLFQKSHSWSIKNKRFPGSKDHFLFNPI